MASEGKTIMTTQSVAKTDGAVVELVSFTSQELDIITDALKLASAHYQMLRETMPHELKWHADLEQQSKDAGELQLKIEAAR